MTGVPPILGWMSSLADVTRVRALRLLEQSELTVADLCAVLQLPQSTVSRHLKVLADDRWVTARPDGTSRLYRMAADELDAPARRLWTLIREQAASARAAAQDEQRLATVLTRRQTRSQAFFRSAAGEWDRMRREMFGERFDLAALAGLLEDTWVFGDLGCGTGQIAESVAPFVRRVIAVDSSRAMLRAAARRLQRLAHVEIRHGALTALPVDDGALDAAAVCLVLHHVADPPAALRDAWRALQPGGRFLVVDMASHERHDYRRLMGHVWLGFEPAQMAAWLETAGFERVRVQPLTPAAAAKGPGLFAATARRPTQRRAANHNRTRNANSQRRKNQ